MGGTWVGNNNDSLSAPFTGVVLSEVEGLPSCAEASDERSIPAPHPLEVSHEEGAGR